MSAFPVPQDLLDTRLEERARQWSMKFAEQVAFDLPIRVGA
ncbi:MAG: hypothetical protein QM736_09955 [Vicinamibacterales bacterium]